VGHLADRRRLHLADGDDLLDRANAAFQVVLIAAISLLLFGWFGTLFLSSTRMIFAAAFDRILPEGAARVTHNGVRSSRSC